MFWKGILHEKSWNQIIQKIIEKKEIAGTILFVPWLATNQWKKLIENCNSVGARTHKIGKVRPTLTLIFSIFEEREKGKLYIYREKFVLVHLKNFHVFILLERVLWNLNSTIYHSFYHVSQQLHLKIFHQPELAILFMTLME